MVSPGGAAPARSRAIPVTYKDAGVDIAAGDELVERIKRHTDSTARPGAIGGIGGFAALFDIKGLGYRDPLIVSTTDGVGTKLKLAVEAARPHGVGIDLVAMNVNDLLVVGAEPLFLLDYYATGKLELAIAERVIAGIAEGCRQAGCALVGGETSEMPGLYAPGDYDVAGFAVGIVERDGVLPRTASLPGPGDVVLGLASAGVHSNGFALVRRILAERRLAVGAPCPFAPGTLADALLTPTRIYVRSCLPLLRDGAVKAAAHITGGGLPGNLARVIPAEVCARIATGTWPVAPVFRWLQEVGQVPPADMFRTFNCGIGLAVVVAGGEAGRIADALRAAGETVYAIGQIVPRAAGMPAVEITAPEAPWRG